MNHSPKSCPALLTIGSRADSYINSRKSWTGVVFLQNIDTSPTKSIFYGSSGQDP
jgi:hypothetical protein